jgi:hypothetical protein
MPRLLIPLALISLAACHRDSAPGGATTAETTALDDAAEMLEHRRLPVSALRQPAPADVSQPGTTAVPSTPAK